MNTEIKKIRRTISRLSNKYTRENPINTLDKLLTFCYDLIMAIKKHFKKRNSAHLVIGSLLAGVAWFEYRQENAKLFVIFSMLACVNLIMFLIFYEQN